MAKRKRDMQLNFRVSAEELAVIEQKMSQFGTSNREAYLRKMALDGYVVKLELPELKELVSLMRRNSNNLNQLTRKVHEKSLPSFPNFYNGDRYSICGGRNGITSLLLSPLFLFIGILVFCLPMPDNMIRKDTKNAARRK